MEVENIIVVSFVGSNVDFDSFPENSTGTISFTIVIANCKVFIGFINIVGLVVVAGCIAIIDFAGFRTIFYSIKFVGWEIIVVFDFIEFIDLVSLIEVNEGVS